MFDLIFNQGLEDFFFITMPIFYIVGMVFCFVGLPVLIYVWKRKIPVASRTLFWAGIRREPPLLLCHDSGRGELTTVRERKGEGIVMTSQGKYKILPRWMPKLPLSFLGREAAAIPQTPTSQGNPTEEEAENSAGENTEVAQGKTGVEVDLDKAINIKFLHDNFILDYGDWVVKRTFLVGLDLPFFVGYTGKLCLLNPEALALYETGEMFIRTEDKVLFNPQGLEGKRIEDAIQPLLLLDPRKIQQIIYEGFDQSQIAGIVADSEELARIGQGISPKMKLLLGILILVVLAGAALFFLPQILSGFQHQGATQTASILETLKHFLGM